MFNSDKEQSKYESQYLALSYLNYKLYNLHNIYILK